MSESTAEQQAMSPEEDEARKQERALVQRWQETISSAKKSELFNEYHKQIKEHRKRVRGIKNGEGTELVRTNLIYSELSSMLPNIYARSPEIAVTPSESVSPQSYELIKQLTRTAEIVVNRLLADGGLKKVGKVSVRSAQTCKIGWVKVSYQKDYKTDPIIKNRINDTQDNILHIEHLLKKVENDDEREEMESRKAELEQAVKALEQQVEVVHAEGAVLDRLLSEDVLWDEEVREFEFIAEHAGWIAHRIWFNAEKYKSTFGKKPGSKATTYNASKTEASTTDKENQNYAVWEIWDKTTTTIFTMCEGDEDWARAPYQLNKLGERWYSLFPLALHPTDGHPLPLSSVELLKKLQDEYEETRDKYADHREKNKPHYIVDSDTDEATIKRKQHAELGEIVILDANGRPLNQVFQRAEQLPIDPAQYDTSLIRSDLEQMGGMGDASKGAVSKAKTLGEAQILQQGLAGRTSEMQDAIEDWIKDIAVYVFEIALQELNLQQVQRIAGADAVWPNMAKEQIYDMVNIEVRAGTSGKPNKAQEQKNWLEFMPQLRELVTNVTELRAKGDNEAADALVKVARETIRRFDERFDVEEFLPQPKENAGGDQVAAMQQQMQEMQKRMEMLDAQIRKTNAEAMETEVDTVLKTGGALPAAQILQ